MTHEVTEKDYEDYLASDLSIEDFAMQLAMEDMGELGIHKDDLPDLAQDIEGELQWFKDNGADEHLAARYDSMTNNHEMGYE